MNKNKTHAFKGIALLLLLAAILFTGPKTPIAEGQIDRDQMYELGLTPPKEVTADLAALNEKAAIECHEIGFTELECPRSNEDTAKRVMATLMTQKVEKTKWGAAGGGYAPKYAEAINRMFYEFLTRLQKEPCEIPTSNYVSEESLKALQKGQFIHRCNTGWRINSEWIEIIQPKEKTQNEKGSTPDVNEVTNTVTIDIAVKDFKIGLYQGQEQLGSAEISLSDLQGKPVVLNYWAGLCPPCWEEMPEFQEFNDEYEGKVTLIGVDLGQYLGLGSRENAQELLTELGVTYPAGFTDDGAVVEAHRVSGLPTTIFVTAEGDLHKKWDGVINKDKLGEIAEEMLANAGG